MLGLESDRWVDGESQRVWTVDTYRNSAWIAATGGVSVPRIEPKLGVKLQATIARLEQVVYKHTQSSTINAS